MNIKRFLRVIVFLGALVYEAQADYKKSLYSQNHQLRSFPKASYNKQVREMQRLYKAAPCTDQAILNEFNALQDKLDINPKLPLFTAQGPGWKLPYNTLAFYIPQLQAVGIITSNFYKQKPLERAHTLYHELRHHLQYTSQKSYNAVLTCMALKKLSYKQAMEYDADDFGVRHATNNCPLCIHELKTAFSPKSYNSAGYFVQKDFYPILQEANQVPNFCAIHKKNSTICNNKQVRTDTQSNPYNINLTIPLLLCIGYKYRHSIIQMLQQTKITIINKLLTN